MEVIEIGSGYMRTAFYDAASAEDDLGGGRIYSALVKQAILKRLHHSDVNPDSIKLGRLQVFPEGGAIIFDTEDKTNMPMQFICPAGFEENFLRRLNTTTGATLLTCTVQDVFECFISTMNTYSIPSWQTFINWFNEKYRGYYNASIDSANLEIISLDGGSYIGIVRTMNELTRPSDLFTWMLSCIPQELKSESSEEIVANNNEEKIGLIFKMTNVGGIFGQVYGDTVTLHFYIRL